MNTEEYISNIMTKDVITVHPDDRLQKIKKMFEEYKFHHVLVLEQGVLKGIISPMDLIPSASISSHNNDDQIKARDVMTSDPLTLLADDSVGLAADIFLSNRIHALPILEDNKVIGIVTSHDIIQYCFK